MKIKLNRCEYGLLFLVIICDEPRRLRRGAPAALQLPENSTPGSQEPVMDACHTFTIFHRLDDAIPVHARFCISRNSLFFLVPVMGVLRLLPVIPF